jgi:hypothetical protein
LALLATGSRSFADTCPRPSSVPLWELVEEAQLVVLADVAGIEEDAFPAPGDPDPFENDVATLRVRETWKGAPVDALPVRFSRRTTCPPPARYEPGALVLAFLQRRGNGWATVGLSSGTIHPTAGSLNDLRVMVLDAIALLGNPPVPSEARLEWHVRAASRSGTRWHGLYELVPGRDVLQCFHDGETRGERWTPDERQLGMIARGFIDDPHLDLAAVSAICTCLEMESPPSWVREAMALVLDRYGDAGSDRLRPLDGPPDDLDTESLRHVWDEARRQLKIPLVRPLTIHEPEGSRARSGDAAQSSLPGVH